MASRYTRLRNGICVEVRCRGTNQNARVSRVVTIGVRIAWTNCNTAASMVVSITVVVYAS